MHPPRFRLYKLTSFLFPHISPAFPAPISRDLPAGLRSIVHRPLKICIKLSFLNRHWMFPSHRLRPQFSNVRRKFRWSGEVSLCLRHKRHKPNKPRHWLRRRHALSPAPRIHILSIVLRNRPNHQNPLWDLFTLTHHHHCVPLPCGRVLAWLPILLARWLRLHLNHLNDAWFWFQSMQWIQSANFLFSSYDRGFLRSSLALLSSPWLFVDAHVYTPAAFHFSYDSLDCHPACAACIRHWCWCLL